METEVNGWVHFSVKSLHENTSLLGKKTETGGSGVLNKQEWNAKFLKTVSDKLSLQNEFHMLIMTPTSLSQVKQN